MTRLQKIFGVSALLASAVAIVGCEGRVSESWLEQLERETAEATDHLQQQGISVKAIDLPDAVYGLRKGWYDIVIPQADGSARECVANVVTTTHNIKNVILTNCK
ncbi:MAG: hypothetical protein H6869_09250 [Rhodospirillales bacterium]|nr:hypothetical protein [Rhodospirillales bacterium]